MKSMTGFGLGGAPLGEGRLMLEIRSLNHRFLDVRVRLPSEIAEHTFFVEQIARERVARGRYDIGVRLEGAALPPPKISLERARAAYRALAELRDELAPGTELSVTSVLTLPNVVASASSNGSEAVKAALSGAFSDALGALDKMRRTEGDALRRELGARLAAMRVQSERIREGSASATQAQRARLVSRVERLMGDAAVTAERGRLELELAILADRSDITEELVRLASHFDQLEALSALEEPVGRRIDFLLQEASREANTIGSKCQDTAIAHAVVELKSEIERMREQVQNVE